jgi:hypothetical protein
VPPKYVMTFCQRLDWDEASDLLDALLHSDGEGRSGDDTSMVEWIVDALKERFHAHHLRQEALDRARGVRGDWDLE